MDKLIWFIRRFAGELLIDIGKRLMSYDMPTSNGVRYRKVQSSGNDSGKDDWVVW